MNINAVILAAGLGTRMKSSIPKVLHPLLGKPIISHIIKTIEGIDRISKRIVVISKHTESVRNVLSGKEIVFAMQTDLLGTADALKDGLKSSDSNFEHILVLAGDAPLVTQTTINTLIDTHIKGKNDITIQSFVAPDPTSYGRIGKDERGKVIAIIEEKDADENQREIQEVNSGIYLFSAMAISYLSDITVNQLKGEYYLTDIVSICHQKGLKVEAVCSDTMDEFIGINSRFDLLTAQKALQWRINLYWMENGVTLMDIDSIMIEPDVKIGSDTTIFPNVILQAGTVIGRHCVICPNTRIINSVIKDKAIIKDSSFIEDSSVESEASIGPFSHIRPNSKIGQNARIGNFVELKNTIIGNNTKASHLSYLGDAELGNDINIGAGTITCNYDGVNKFKTTIKDGVFIGSDTQIVAPVTINENSFVAAGSTITKDIPSGSLAISRVKQTNLEGWAKKRIPHLIKDKPKDK
ncbi:MAG: bifunctional UDP-N-acetylglucosamine diphosphorylase/glucosamine-1-phosphate N-acetyltransferase GlmU [Nitrospirae bacterium]|nr:bifunctional UDP-N-acetylglucosamine diphosphorylase/glucosamine-1-phosphate N-acetyltransferase GlmU [Nitrospirota bacterium]